MRKLVHPAMMAPLPTPAEHKKLDAVAGAPRRTEASNADIEMRTGKEVEDFRPEMESLFAQCRLSENAQVSHGDADNLLVLQL